MTEKWTWWPALIGMKGPTSQKNTRFTRPRPSIPGLLDNFLTFTGDFNGDGWPDVLYVPYPGTDAYWYENPGRRADRGRGTWPCTTWATSRPPGSI